MAKLRLDDKTVRGLLAPASGNRIDYDVPKGLRDTDFVRGFAIRTTAAGAKAFLLIYVTKDGRERRQKIGDFGPHTVTTARAEARRLRVRVDAGEDPFAQVQQARENAQATRSRDEATFGDLLGAYVAQLRRGKRPSADKVEGEIHRTIKTPFAALWKSPAAAVTLDDLVRITGRLVRAGKIRQAEKTRSYLRAAYTAAAASRGNASTADLFERFAHVPNVARDLGTIDRPKHADAQPEAAKRALSVDELRAYWKRIKSMPGAQGALLRFHLLTGAQRCEQLARLTTRQFDRDAATITLLDGKGRRTRVREHVIPLLPEAVAAIELMAGTEGSHLFTLDQGEHGAAYHTVRALVAKVADAMAKAEETTAAFTPGELRITVETRLAAAGVSREVRAQLQSHGLGGVQGKHYDKHGYMDEKRAALEALRRIASGASATVTPIKRATRSASRGDA